MDGSTIESSKVDFVIFILQEISYREKWRYIAKYKEGQKKDKKNLRGSKEGTEREQRGTREGPKNHQKGTKLGPEMDQSRIKENPKIEICSCL